MNSQRSLTLTPLLTDGQHNVPPQDIIINGHRRQKAYMRGLAIEKEAPDAIVIPFYRKLYSKQIASLSLRS